MRPGLRLRPPELEAPTVADHEPRPPFEQLDFLYTPSSDPAAEAKHLEQTTGARVVFAVESMGTRVAAIELTSGPPLLLLTDHLEGERPILVYRVADLDAALRDLEARGWTRDRSFEIPHGPGATFRTPQGLRIAVYQATRPEAAHHFDGRRDF